VDRTLRKSQTRNNDGERQMKILESYKEMMYQFINEADVDDDKIIKYKDKEGESQEMTAGAAKRQPDDHPAKVAYNKMSAADDDSEKDGDKLSGSDFDRDGGDSSSAGPDPDMKGEPSEVEQAIKSAEDLADKYGIESDVAGNEQGLNRANIGAGGEYEGDNQLTVSYDDEQYHIGIQGEDAMQGPIGYMSFDSKEEMESALDKILGNEKIKDALKKGDSLEGMKDEIESLGKGGSDDNAESDDIEISDANSGPIDRDDIMDMLKNDSEVVDKMGDDVYWDGVDLVSSKFDDDTIASVDGNMTLGDLKKQIIDYEEEQDESIKVIDGKKYKAIKESKKNPQLFKEIYERTFRSLK